MPLTLFIEFLFSAIVFFRFYLSSILYSLLKILIKITLKYMSDSSNIWITFQSIVYFLIFFPLGFGHLFLFPGMLVIFLKNLNVYSVQEKL